MYDNSFHKGIFSFSVTESDCKNMLLFKAKDMFFTPTVVFLPSL